MGARAPEARRLGCRRLAGAEPRGRGWRYGRLSVGWLAERQGAGPVGLQGGVERGKTASVRWLPCPSLLCRRFAPAPIALRLRAACEDFLASGGFVLLGRVVSRAFHQARGRAWVFASGRFSRRPLWVCGCSTAPARRFGKGHQLRPSFACCLLMHLLCFGERVVQRDGSSRPLHLPLVQDGNEFAKKF